MTNLSSRIASLKRAVGRDEPRLLLYDLRDMRAMDHRIERLSESWYSNYRGQQNVENLSQPRRLT